MAILAGLIPLIPALIQTAERLFVKSKSGKDKMDAVRTALRAVLEKYAVTDGSAVTVTDDYLTGLVEAVFQSLAVNGQVNVPQAGGVPLGRVLLVIDGKAYRLSEVKEV